MNRQNNDVISTSTVINGVELTHQIVFVTMMTYVYLLYCFFRCIHGKLKKKRILRLVLFLRSHLKAEKNIGIFRKKFSSPRVKKLHKKPYGMQDFITNFNEG